MPSEASRLSIGVYLPWRTLYVNRCLTPFLTTESLHCPNAFSRVPTYVTIVGFTYFSMARGSSPVTRTYSPRGSTQQSAPLSIWNLVCMPFLPTFSVIMRLMPTLFTVVSAPTSNSLSLSELCTCCTFFCMHRFWKWFNLPHL